MSSAIKARLLVAVGFAAVVIGVYFLARSPHARIVPSQHPSAPDFSLKDLAGHDIVLSSYHGKVVLLNFWATWCSPCRAEIPRFIQFQDTYGPRGFQVLGISMDDDSKPVLEFRNEFQVNYPIVMGDAAVGESYGGVLGLPITFLIDREGRIDAKHIGAVDAGHLEQEIQKLLLAH